MQIRKLKIFLFLFLPWGYYVLVRANITQKLLEKKVLSAQYPFYLHCSKIVRLKIQLGSYLAGKALDRPVSCHFYSILTIKMFF